MTALPAMTFGQFIRESREKLGYSINEVAQKSGISVPSLWQYEADGSRPFATNLYKLAAVFELTANDLEPYEFKHTKKIKIKPIAKIQIAIRHGIKDAALHMTGASPFECKMKDKVIAAFTQCDEILKSIEFLDAAF